MTQASPPAATPRPLVTADPRHFAFAFDPRHTIGLIHVDDVVANPALLEAQRDSCPPQIR